jgi:hypothetical protein
MLCPYCVDEIQDGSTQHAECRMVNNRPFPLFYQDYHGDDQADDPIVFSVVGFSGHGKTVYLAALFDYLDHHLTDIWPGFAASVLDQDSLTRLNENRRRLRNGELPARTAVNFPRPGILRPSGMPHLTDRTVLVCDPPGEAFMDQEQIRELAGFVQRSQCVLFLIDLGSLGDASADEMATLLETYLLGLRAMGIRDKRQHLVVVYTKADRMRAMVPGFADFLTRSPELNTWLRDLRPETLGTPDEHLRQLQQISNRLLQFTREDLNASKFTNLAEKRFESVTYTAVTSLGASPEGEGDQQRLKVRMAPRCVVDPFLVMLDKSSHLAPAKPARPPVVKIPERTKPPLWRRLFFLLASVLAAVTLFLLFQAALPQGEQTIATTPSAGGEMTYGRNNVPTPGPEVSQEVRKTETPKNVRESEIAVRRDTPTPTPETIRRQTLQPEIALPATPAPTPAPAPTRMYVPPTPFPTIQQPTATPTPRVQVATPAPTPVYTGPRKGMIQLSLELDKGQEFPVTGKLPGIPVRIDSIEPRDLIGIAQVPGPSNNWTRLVIRSRSKVHVVVTIYWSAL